MSSPAPSPAVQPDSQEATAAWPHQLFEGMRRLPVRDAQPPFDDEVAMFTATVDPRQGALKLAFALPNGLPAIPQAAPSPRVDDDERTPHLRLVPNDDAADNDAPLGVSEGHGPTRKRPARDIGDDEFGPRQTPRTQLPDPKPWAGRLVQAIVEVASGVRPVSQLVRWTSADVYESVQLRLRTTPIAAMAMQVKSRPQFAEVVRSVHVSEPGDGIVEVCAILQRGPRCRAIALRLEGLDGRWQCTALHIG